MSARDFPVRQADERLTWKRPARLGAAAVLVGLACVVVEWQLGRSAARGSITGVVPFVAAAPRGTVEQELTVEKRGEDLVASQRRRLSSYGWVDRGRGIAHIPIERAMELTEARDR